MFRIEEIYFSPFSAFLFDTDTVPVQNLRLLSNIL